MLILATKSSTKRSLMDRSGLEYIAMPADVDECSIENAHPSLNAKETVILLARAKAKKLSLVYPNEFILMSLSLLLIHLEFYQMGRGCIRLKLQKKR